MYNIEGLKWLIESVPIKPGMRVLEFGNQHIWTHAARRFQIQHTVARDWFLHDLQAAEYVAIDLNGQDDAIPTDLTLPIQVSHPEFTEKFDLVTNIGSTEHFGKQHEKQWQAFLNTVAVCRIGGYIAHQLPPEKQWLDHCDIWYKDGLGNVLAKYTGCTLIKEERLNLATLNKDVDYICILLQKTKTESCTDTPLEFREKLVW